STGNYFIRLGAGNDTINVTFTPQTAPATPPTDTISGFIAGDDVDFPFYPNLTLGVASYAGNSNEVDLYSSGKLVTKLIFSGGVSTTALEPVSDGTGGTEVVVDPASVSPSASAVLTDPQLSQVVGASSLGTGGTIDWGFIHQNEGGNWLNPYVPPGKKSG